MTMMLAPSKTILAGGQEKSADGAAEASANHGDQAAGSGEPASRASSDAAA
jgi:hypothetical protein